MAYISDQLTVFSWALERAQPNDYLNAPGLGMFKAKHLRDGMARGVVVTHSSGLGLALVMPPTHGVCRECASSKSRSVCEHCACAMCQWFARTDERASPRVSRDRWRELAVRIQALEFSGPKPPTPVALDEEI